MWYPHGRLGRAQGLAANWLWFGPISQNIRGVLSKLKGMIDIAPEMAPNLQ